MRKTKILLILIIGTLTANAQTFGYGEQVNDYIYAKATLDPNQLFGIIDNPRTKTESYGLDYDIEIGARWKSVGIYAFYGAFQEIDYVNTGFGFDVYINWFEDYSLSTSVGASTGLVGRKYYSHENQSAWGFGIAPAIRTTATYWIHENIGITLTAQGQHRPDIDKLMIFEGHAGIVVRLHNKPRLTRF